MYVADGLVYLQLPKTGCSHIAELLARILPGQQIGVHERLPEHLRDSGRRIVGSIRNPWDWYVSLWSYGCAGGGAVRHSLITAPPFPRRDVLAHPGGTLRDLVRWFRKPVRAWKRSYERSDDPRRFRDWLYRVLDPSNAVYLGEGYGESALCRSAGFFTYRYLFLFSRDSDALFSHRFASPSDLLDFDATSNILTHTIRTESLSEDLIAVLRSCGVILTDEQVHLIRCSGRTNASSRHRQFELYYDNDTAELVRTREEFLITKYGYAIGRVPTRGHGPHLSFPVLGSASY